MNSLFANRGRLSDRTREAFMPGYAHRDIEERLRCYLSYLEEVFPIGLAVRHIPADRANLPRANSQNTRHWISESREEIQLLTYGGRIFMSGLVSMDRNPTTVETIAGDEAYTQWDNGDFIQDEDRWRFFTGSNNLIRLFRSDHGDGWSIPSEFHPINQARDVAGYLQREFDRIDGYN